MEDQLFEHTAGAVPGEQRVDWDDRTTSEAVVVERPCQPKVRHSESGARVVLSEPASLVCRGTSVIQPPQGISPKRAQPICFEITVSAPERHHNRRSAAPGKLPTEKSKVVRPRTAGSPEAVAAVEAYMQCKAIGLGEFCNEIGITMPTLRRFLNNKGMQRDCFHRVAERLGVTPEALLRGDMSFQCLS